MELEIEDKSLVRTRQFAWIAIALGCIGISIILANALFGFAVTGAKGAIDAIQGSEVGKSANIFRSGSTAKAKSPSVGGGPGTASEGAAAKPDPQLTATDSGPKIVPGAIPSSKATALQELNEVRSAASLPDSPSQFERMINEMLASRPAEFRPGSSILSWNGKTNLDHIVPLLKAKPDWRFEIGAHVAASDTADADRITTQRRAEAIVGYLGTEGVSSIRMSTKGYGSSKPIGDNGTELGRLRNQRVELRVTGTQ